jgi:hypothetical protein
MFPATHGVSIRVPGDDRDARERMGKDATCVHRPDKNGYQS